MNDPAAAEQRPMEDGLLSSLNEAQRQAVEAVEGPVLVLAGAGTGKTRVLTTRIAHILLNRYAFPGEILAVTFTNRAAREMAERVRALTGVSQAMWMGTFHSLCARILRRHAERLGFTGNFSILDDDDQLRLIKAILRDKNIDEKSLPPKLAHAVIQNWKDQGLTPEKLTAAVDRQALSGRGPEIYREYQARLKSVNAMDFGDLILHVLTLFAAHDEVLKEYSQRFRYILVDEYQDTNVAQYLWLRLLALAHKNICCVGDDDQSIYSWRGAEVGNILRFEKDFPGARVIRLECNYRSGKHILGAASGLIAHNKGRLGKTLWTPAEGGVKVRIKPVWDDAEEARFIGEEIESFQRAKMPLSEMAILVRAGFQTRAFEERFLSMGIPYRVIGGLRFYERAEIRDAVAYLRVVASPQDDLAFERILNVPKRGIGQATMQQIHACARQRDGSLYEAAAHLLSSGGFKGKLAEAIGQLMEGFARWRQALDTVPMTALAEQVLEESGYKRMWQQDKSPEAAGRLENLRELTRALGEFENIADFLEHVGLVTERQQEGSADMVSLMTLHAAKGLEFTTVFLPGWEEGLFPHQRAVDESGMKGLEEERRLAYVGMTRARENLIILHAANRRMYNQWQASVPSRFLAELPSEHVERLNGGAYGNGGGGLNWRQEIASIMSGAGKQEPLWSVGTRVFHQKFGYGIVQEVQGDHLDIRFDKAGDKKVMAGFVQKA
ncbi:MAG: UvrD-helicase domain-containing protein [Alphaproteobacteria bacterium]|nr:UvrD-helicase domain-containing protein [Alphaproteobacteria bacterium]